MRAISPVFCDGLSRRDALRLCCGFVRMAVAPATPLPKRPRPMPAKAMIFVFLHGCDTTDTFNLKPDAPAEFRGEFKPIDTNVRGVQIC